MGHCLFDHWNFLLVNFCCPLSIDKSERKRNNILLSQNLALPQNKTTMTAADTKTQDDDAEMRALVKKWERENKIRDGYDVESDDSESSEYLNYDDLVEKFRRDVKVTDKALDHVILGACDMDEALDNFEALTGHRPLVATTQKGLGTKSALLAFEQCAFLEIIAPDPMQTQTDRAKKLAKIPSGKLVPVHYAIRNSKSQELKSSLWTAAMKLECDEVTMVSKDRGMPWKWNLFFLEKDGKQDGMIPVFVDWGKGTHASARNPVLGKLDSVKVHAPSNSHVHKLLGGVSGIKVLDSDEPKFEFKFTTKTGEHVFSSSSLVGAHFPKC